MLLMHYLEHGNTLVIIEHNPEVIKCADWIIDLGPEGGEQGGYWCLEAHQKSLPKARNLLPKIFEEEVEEAECVKFIASQTFPFAPSLLLLLSQNKFPVLGTKHLRSAAGDLLPLFD
jgi:hypothetical protein